MIVIRAYSRTSPLLEVLDEHVAEVTAAREAGRG